MGKPAALSGRMTGENMYAQTQANHGNGSISGGISARDAGRPAMWESHIKMEQMHQAAGAKALDPRGTLEASIDGVGGAISDAFAALDRLADRLHLVLQPELPAPVGAAGLACSTPPTSPAVHRLHGLRNQLELLTARVNALHGRLDA